MSSLLMLDGLALPLQPTPAGPLIDTQADKAAAPLGWVVNAAVTGAFPGLRERLAAGEDATTTGLAAVRPELGEDVAAETALWHEAGGGDPGDDTYLVSTTFMRDRLLVPRRTLLAVLDALEERRAGPAALEPEELDELERRAAELDELDARTAEGAATAAAKRRFLLFALDEAGAFARPPEPALATRPRLAEYVAAGQRLLAYLESDDRRAAGLAGGEAAVVGAPVSVDWFRRPSPLPNPLERAAHWLAFCESVFRAADLGDATAGDVWARRDGEWFALAWRRDDGTTPALVAARPTG